MKNTKKYPHFVNTTHPKEKPWLTNVYVGLRDGSGSHAHITISGADFWYVRKTDGKEIIKDGKVIENTSPSK